MARNKIQFQKGLSLNAFLKEYGTEEQCLMPSMPCAGLMAFAAPSADTTNAASWPIGDCSNATAANDRHRSRQARSSNDQIALTVWFQAMYLMTQNRRASQAMASAQAARHFLQRGLAEATADAGHAGEDEGKPLTGFIEVDDAYLGGEHSGGKRGRGAG